MSITDYLPFATRFLSGTGLVPSSGFLTRLVSMLIWLPTNVILNFMIIYNFGKANGDIAVIAETFEALSTYAQLTSRQIMFFMHGDLIQELIDDCNKQWPYDLFGQVLEKKLRRKMFLCVQLAKALGYCCIITICLMGATAVFNSSKPVPLLCWIPDLPWARQIVFVIQMFQLLVAILYVLSTDSFYILVTMDIQNQFILLTRLVQSIEDDRDDVKMSITKLTKCVQHHRWILKFKDKLNKIFSEYFIMQYSLTVLAVAMQCYLLIYTKPSPDAAIKGVVYVFNVMFQVALYFVPASNIEIEAEKFSDTLYFVNWENTLNIKFMKHITLMLVKSQQSIEMVGAGMLHITRARFLAIMRLGFTIATFFGKLRS